MTVDLRNNPDWRKLAPFGLHVDGTPMSKEEYQAMHGKTKDITVSIDTSTVEELARSKIAVEQKEKELDEKLEKVEGTEVVFEQLKSAVEEKYEREHLAVPKIENLEDLNNASQNLSEIKRRTQSKSGINPNSGGSAPLQNQYGSQNQGSFESEEAMINSLNDRCSSSNKDLADKRLALAQREELLRKMFRGQKETGKPFDFKGENVLEFRRQQFQRRKKLAKGEP